MSMFKRKNEITVKNVTVNDDKLIIEVSNSETIIRGKEIFLVTPSKPKTQFNRIGKINDVIVRAKVEIIQGKTITLSSLQDKTATEAESFIKNCSSVFVKTIEKW